MALRASTFARSRWRKPAVGVWLVIGAAVLLQLGVPFSLIAGLRESWTVSRLPESEQQRYLNGPLVAYARQLNSLLPLQNSCVELVVPDVSVLRENGRDWIFERASILETVLYPRLLRLAADTPEAVAGGGCGPYTRYIVVWMESGSEKDVQQLGGELAALDSEPAVEQMSDYTDDEGNTGKTFQVIAAQR